MTEMTLTFPSTFAPQCSITGEIFTPEVGEYVWVLMKEGFYSLVYSRSSAWDFPEEEGFHPALVKILESK